MDYVELKPGFQYILENNVTQSEVKLLQCLIDENLNIYELEKALGQKGTSRIYRTLKILMLKNLVKSSLEEPETLSRYSMI